MNRYVNARAKKKIRFAEIHIFESHRLPFSSSSLCPPAAVDCLLGAPCLSPEPNKGKGKVGGLIFGRSLTSLWYSFSSFVSSRFVLLGGEEDDDIVVLRLAGFATRSTVFCNFACAYVCVGLCE